MSRCPNLTAPAVQAQAGGGDAVMMDEKFVTGNGTATLGPSQATIHAHPTRHPLSCGFFRDTKILPPPRDPLEDPPAPALNQQMRCLDGQKRKVARRWMLSLFGTHEPTSRLATKPPDRLTGQNQLQEVDHLQRRPHAHVLSHKNTPDNILWFRDVGWDPEAETWSLLRFNLGGNVPLTHCELERQDMEPGTCQPPARSSPQISSRK